MATQKDHLDNLHPAYKALAEALQDGNLQEAETHLAILGKSIQGLNTRLINDDILARIAEGTNIALVGLAARNAQSTLKNKNAANSVDGVLVDYKTIINLFESIRFYESTEIAGKSNNILFYNCLAMLARMFNEASPGENDVLKNMAERAMLPR